MCDSLNTGRYGAAIIAYLEDAFDAAWRKGLIYKLYYSGIKGGLLILLDNFLIDKMSRNNVNDYVGEWFPTTNRPSTKFNTQSYFISCLQWRSISRSKKSCLYDNSYSLETTNENVTPLNESKFADDYHLWRTSYNITDQESSLQSDLTMINCWCHKWRINLNLKKTNVLLFNGKHKWKSEKISIKINQTAILKHQRKWHWE